MKKVYDWDICLLIHVENHSKNITIVCSIHTTIHQLKIEICKKLHLPIFDTQIDIYHTNNNNKPMKSISTLQQNGIEGKKNVIRAIIRREKTNPMLDVHVEENVSKRKQSKGKQNGNFGKEGYGLSLIASCVNPQCINYQQDTVVYVGYGSIRYYQFVGGLKCQLCPYRSQFLRPSMMCKNMKLSHCLYKLEGTKTDYQGIPTQVSTKFTAVREQKDIVHTKISKQWDRNVVLIVKHF